VETGHQISLHCEISTLPPLHPSYVKISSPAPSFQTLNLFLCGEQPRFIPIQTLKNYRLVQKSRHVSNANVFFLPYNSASNLMIFRINPYKYLHTGLVKTC
jgi:hypothetical protein